MAMAKTLSRAGRKRGDEIEDRGCRYAPKCANCPWRMCIKELPTRERLEFITALRLIEKHLLVEAMP